MSTWWMSCVRMTVGVETDAQEVITSAAPVVRVFVGQPRENLRQWMKRMGGYQEARLL